MIAALATRLNQLAPRERLLLAVLAFAVLPAFILFGVLANLQDQRNAAATNLGTAKAEAAWVQTRLAEFNRLASAKTTDAPAAPIGLGEIESRLVEAGLRQAALVTSNPEGDGVELVFAKVPFNHLMAWLERFERDAGYHVSQLRIDATDAPGLVDATVLTQANQ